MIFKVKMMHNSLGAMSIEKTLDLGIGLFLFLFISFIYFIIQFFYCLHNILLLPFWCFLSVYFINALFYLHVYTYRVVFYYDHFLILSNFFPFCYFGIFITFDLCLGSLDTFKTCFYWK